MIKKDGDIVGWMTVNGNHIPIKKGQTREQAMLEFLGEAEGSEPFAKKPKNKTLSKKEFAVWYQKIGEIKRRGYVRKNKSKEAYIPLEEQDELGKVHCKIAVTSGSYEKPRLKRVLEFRDRESMYKFLGFMEG